MFALLLGLASPAAAAPAEASPPVACPTRYGDPPACPAGSALGTTVDTPYEWGPAASGMQPWWGRLACSDGRIPVVRRHGGVATPAKVSTSPPSGEPTFGRGDVVDAWEIGCPEARYLLYTNVYRCGVPCLPATLKAVSGDAVRHLDAAEAAAKAGNVEGALIEARAATDTAPDHERTWVFRGNLAEGMGRWDDAVTIWAAALVKFPGGISESHRAEALARAGRTEEARALAAKLLSAAPDAPTRPRLLCVSSIVEPDPKKGKALADQACAEGYRRCCSP